MGSQGPQPLNTAPAQRAHPGRWDLGPNSQSWRSAWTTSASKTKSHDTRTGKGLAVGVWQGLGGLQWGYQPWGWPRSQHSWPCRWPTPSPSGRGWCIEPWAHSEWTCREAPGFYIQLPAPSQEAGAPLHWGHLCGHRQWRACRGARGEVTEKGRFVNKKKDPNTHNRL